MKKEQENKSKGLAAPNKSRTFAIREPAKPHRSTCGTL